MNLEPLLNHIRLPKNHWECRLSEIPDKAPYKAALSEWVENIRQNVQSGGGILFFGKFGYGKSGCAAIILKAALSKSILGLWVPCESLVDYKIREDQYLFSENLTMWQRLQQVPILVIDDLTIRPPSKRGSEFVEAVHEFLIRRRIDNKLSTIITTNESKENIIAHAPALDSLLNEGFLKFKIEARDFRRDKA